MDLPTFEQTRYELAHQCGAADSHYGADGLHLKLRDDNGMALRRAADARGWQCVYGYTMSHDGAEWRIFVPADGMPAEV